MGCIQTNLIRINEKIGAREVRVIDDEGNQLGIKTLVEAIAIARRRNMDLVEVAAKASPPVCKIMDFGKYKYELAKKAKENRKSQKNVVVKELKFRLKIDKHDFETKIGKGIEFLEEGNRLKIVIMFRGREVVYRDLGIALRDRIAERLQEVGKIESLGDLVGHNMIILVNPKNESKS